MSYEDIIYHCKKLVALYEVYDELWSMRIHNDANCKAFDKEISYHINKLKELL